MVPVHSKNVVLLNQTISTAATTSAIVDRLGYDFARIEIGLRAATATNSSAKFLALKVMHSDSTAVSNATNISGYIGTTNSTAVSTGTAIEFVIPAHNNTVAFGGTSQAAGQTIRIDVPCQGKGRYLFLIAEGGDSHSTVYAKADLYRGKEVVPTSTTDVNVTTIVAPS